MLRNYPDKATKGALTRVRRSCCLDSPLVTRAVVVEDLRRVFGDTRAVDGATWAAETGQITCVLGPNGAGKTTTIECLEGLQRPDSGSCRVLGVDPWQAGADHRARVGVMLRDGGLPQSVSAARLLGHLQRLYRSHRIDELVDRPDITPFARTPVRRLSGGQRQRVAPAAALLGDPEVAFLDEPTAGLDPHARLAVWDLIRERRDEGVAPGRHHPRLRRGRAPGRPDRHPRPRHGRRGRHARRHRWRGPARGRLLRPDRRNPWLRPPSPPRSRRGAASSPGRASRQRSSPATASSCSSRSCCPPRPWSP
ncbi:ABC transporter ATP-binding protein [Janibacter limosus]|uniref:ABC transporter ATP-binding protein n=1 Tax=Janibacter limosus TaxID=53458 RepID=UPI0035DBD47D